MSGYLPFVAGLKLDGAGRIYPVGPAAGAVQVLQPNESILIHLYLSVARRSQPKRSSELSLVRSPDSWCGIEACTAYTQPSRQRCVLYRSGRHQRRI
jgi:hypothetical protein